MATECRNCGAFVTERFAAVFGDNDDRIFGCRECMTVSELKEGDASEPDSSQIPPSEPVQKH